MSSFFERMLKHEIDTANDHLPRVRVPLDKLLREEHPCFMTRGGEPSFFRREELELLRGLVPERYRQQISLPIVIMRRPDLGAGLYTIAGSRPELFLINRVASGALQLDWREPRTWRIRETLARPEVQVVRRKLPSTTCVGIAVSSHAHAGNTNGSH